jgi:hypothetical protein
VSLRFRDEVAVYVAPRKLALVRRSRGLRSRVVESAEVVVAAGVDGVFARLAEIVAAPEWQNAVARVVVSDHPWACYGVVEWPKVRLDAAARLAHARYVLGDTYGEAVADWTVTLADNPPGRPSVACAVQPTLCASLEAALTPARLQLVSLQPRLIVAFNHWRSQLPSDDAWFVSMDEWSLSAVHVKNRGWDRVYMARLSSDFQAELERLKSFARLTKAAGAQGRMFVDAPIWMRGGASSNAEIEWLEGTPGEGGQAHEMALLQRLSA